MGPAVRGKDPVSKERTQAILEKQGSRDNAWEGMAAIHHHGVLVVALRRSKRRVAWQKSEDPDLQKNELLQLSETYTEDLMGETVVQRIIMRQENDWINTILLRSTTY